MANKLKDRIFAADDRKSEIIDVPEWDVKVQVRELNGDQRDKLYDTATSEDGTIIRAAFVKHLLVNSLYDPEDGEPIFSIEDAPELVKKSGAVLQKLVDAAMRINGLGATAVIDERKNSNGSPSDDSSTSLQKVSV